MEETENKEINISNIMISKLKDNFKTFKSKTWQEQGNIICSFAMNLYVAATFLTAIYLFITNTIGNLVLNVSAFEKFYNYSTIDDAYYYLIVTSIGMALFYVLKMTVFSKNILQLKNFSIVQWIKSYPELLMLLIAFIYTIVATMFAPNRDIAINGNKYNYEGLKTVCLYAVIFLCSYSVSSDKTKKRMFNALIVLGTIIGWFYILIYIARLNSNNNFMAYYSWKNLVFNNSNHAGYWLCVVATLSAASLVFANNGLSKFGYGVSFVVMSILLVINDTLGAFLGLTLGMIFILIIYFLNGRKKWYEPLVPMLIFLIIFVVITLTVNNALWTSIKTFIKDFGILNNGSSDSDAIGHTGSGRMGLWIGTLAVIAATPWIGKGLDCYYDNNVYNSKLDMPHNEYIQFASNVGVIPDLLYIVTIMWVFIRGLKHRKELSSTKLICYSAMFAYCVSAFFGNTFTYTYPLFLILFAFSCGRSDNAVKYGCYKKKPIQVDENNNTSEKLPIEEVNDSVAV